MAIGYAVNALIRAARIQRSQAKKKNPIYDTIFSSLQPHVEATRSRLLRYCVIYSTNDAGIS